jgi:hypothetical protein
MECQHKTLMEVIRQKKDLLSREAEGRGEEREKKDWDVLDRSSLSPSGNSSSVQRTACLHSASSIIPRVPPPPG